MQQLPNRFGIALGFFNGPALLKFSQRERFGPLNVGRETFVVLLPGQAEPIFSLYPKPNVGLYIQHSFKLECSFRLNCSFSRKNLRYQFGRSSTTTRKFSS